MIDTADRPGLVVMVRSILGSEPHFHCFAPWRLAWETTSLAESIADAIFVESLQVPWGILGLMSSDNGPWVWPEQRHQPFLDAALSFWDELDAVGARYYVVGKAERLWNTARNLKYVLANMGVPNDVLRAPLPPEWPRALLRYARPTALDRASTGRRRSSMRRRSRSTMSGRCACSVAGAASRTYRVRRWGCSR